MEQSKMSDVAKAARVSVTTVGRVLHNSGYISEEVRERVQKAVAELSYVPNKMARALKQQKSGIIGSLVVYNQNNLYQKINSSVIEAVEGHGYKLVTMEGRLHRRDEEELIDQFIGMQVDALVITSNSHMTGAMFDKLRRLKIPVVAIERTYDHPYVDNLVVRDFEGAYAAAENCIRHGHTRVALIASALTDTVERERYRGYAEALRDNGIEPEKRLCALMQDYSILNGYLAMKQLYAAAPTAVFCTADTLAAGAMQFLYQQKVRIPEDISIIGYDNVIAQTLSPPIDSIDLAIQDIGELVFQLLEQRMREIDAPAVTKVLDTIYVDRGTVISREN